MLYLMHKHNRINDKQYADAKKIDLKANLVERTKKERQVTGNEKILSMILTLISFNLN